MNLLRRWLIATIFLSSISTILVASIVCLIRSGQNNPFPLAMLTFVSGIMLIRVISRWQKWFASYTVLRKQSKITLDGGTIEFAMPIGRCEIWILCETPFAQYHGQIIFTDSNNNIETIAVKRRDPVVGRVRSDFTPIVWEPSASAELGGQKVVLRFDLIPSFRSDSFGLRSVQKEFQLVEVAVRTVRVFQKGSKR